MKKSRMLSVTLVVVIVMSLFAINASATGSYDPAAATTWARNNCTSSTEQCAGFVASCLNQGGVTIDIPSNRTVGILHATLQNSGFQQYEMVANSNGRFYHSVNANAAVGDVIIYKCSGCTAEQKPNKHAVIITAIDSDIIKVTGTNSTPIYNDFEQGAYYNAGCGHGNVTKVEKNKAFDWTFTPDDAENYEVRTGSVVPYKKANSNASSATQESVVVAAPKTGDGRMFATVSAMLFALTGLAFTIQKKKKND